MINKGAQCNLGKNAKQPRCPPRADWTKADAHQGRSVHTVEYYTAVKMNDIKYMWNMFPTSEKVELCVCVCVCVCVSEREVPEEGLKGFIPR